MNDRIGRDRLVPGKVVRAVLVVGCALGFGQGGVSPVRAEDPPLVAPPSFPRLVLQKGPTREVHRVAAADEGSRVLTDGDKRLILWDCASSMELRRLAEATGSLETLVLSPGGTRVVAAALAWVFADDPFRPLRPEVFMRDYDEPRLLPRILSGEPLPDLRPLGSLNRVQPSVSILAVKPTDRPEVVEVSVAVSGASAEFRRGGRTVTMRTGAYDLRLFRDGQLVGRWPSPAAGDDGLPEPDPTQPDQFAAWRDANRVPLGDSGRATRTFTVRLPRQPGRRSEFTAYAFNEDRMKGVTASFIHDLPDDVPPATPRAYVLSFGASGFSDPAWDLSFADSDARAVAAELGQALRRAGRYEVVSVVLATPRGGAGQPPRPGEASATKSHLKAVLARLAGGPDDPAARAAVPGYAALAPATPDDLVLLFASSHGYTDKRGVYHLFPEDIGGPRAAGRSVDETSQRDRALLKACISGAELSSWLREVDAGQLALVFDSNHAAATVEQPGFKPDPMGRRGLGQLAYDKAMRVLAASAADGVALEARVAGEGHGLLTHALLREGLRGGQAAGPGGTLTLGGLLRYAEARVPLLHAEVIGAADAGKGATEGGTRVLASRGAAMVPLGNAPAPPDSSLHKRGAFQTPALFDFARGRDAALETER